MDGCHRDDPTASNRDPFSGTRGYLRVRWLKFGAAIRLKYWDFDFRSMRPWIPLRGIPTEKSAHSHALMYSECRLVADGSK